MIIPDKKKAVTVILAKHRDGAVEHQEVRPEESTEDGMQILMGISEDLMHAVKNNSAHGVAMALKAAFEHLDAEPHYEGPHEEE